ncbi:MAG: heavy-metal-associated domain-containing protein [Chloroflexi bacterium]|nr:heavy-metal-associated domain-containing protein [Chloroflexota bacterium]
MAVVAASDTIRTERYAVQGMTCGSCERHVQKALRAVPGVETVRVDVASGMAVVERDPAAAPIEQLVLAVKAAGYELMTTADQTDSTLSHPLAIWPLAIGGMAAAGLFGLYLGLVTLTQGWTHATELLAEDLWFVLPIMLGFGTQVGLFTFLRLLRASASAGGVAASTGTSTAAMLACCAHHVVDVLPVIGLSGAALFLSAYKAQLLWLGLGMNMSGVAYLLWQLQRWHRRACCA